VVTVTADGDVAHLTLEGPMGSYVDLPNLGQVDEVRADLELAGIGETEGVLVTVLGLEAGVASLTGEEPGERLVQIAQRLLKTMAGGLGQPLDLAAQILQFGRLGLEGDGPPAASVGLALFQRQVPDDPAAARRAPEELFLRRG